MSKQRTRRVVGVAAAVSLMAVGLVSTSGSSPAAADDDESTPTAEISPSEYYINYAEPRVQESFGIDLEVSGGQVTSSSSASSVLQATMELDEKHSTGNPVTASALAALESRSIQTGQSPKVLKSQYRTVKETQEAKLLTILVEFNPEANDDFTGVQVPESFGAAECTTGTVQNGPLHNNIANPADGALADNNSMWVPDFSSEHFNQMLFTKEGITERVRTDLRGPDGRRGFDISGYSMKNMYEEMSHNAYTVTGEATPWITVPHSEGWYGASVCHLNDEGVYEAGAVQDMQGHPDNPLGAGQLAIDAVDALSAQVPDFPWADYDIEDQGDRDGDGNYFEPDGVIDHVVLVHAGADKSGGGGAEGTYAIWAHSSAVVGGYEIPAAGGLKISNYIVQPEDSGVGVFAHEYGHDLGLPDLYDTASGGDSDIDFWDLMSSGSHAGPIFQSMPTHMGLWDKWVLGWVNPVEIDPGGDLEYVKVGQNSRPLKASRDGIKVNLPDKVVTLAEPHSGGNMWYSSGDQSWADVTLMRSVDVPAAGGVFWMWNNYAIEEDWDYGFVEVSTDGGATWAEHKVFAEDGTEVSTPDGYSDPNGRMTDFGGKQYGLTGHTADWEHHYIDLNGYAGTTVQVRLRYATDAAFEETGWFADDFALESEGVVVWEDDVESGDNGWTPVGGSFLDTTGAGWRMDSGTSVFAQYYLVEWRNFDGFDKGLLHTYDSTYLTDLGEWKVEKIRYNAPGALIWYRDTTYGGQNHVLNNLYAGPSTGAKGGLLIVDSHYDPLRRTGAAADADPSTLNNMPSRPQSSNAAFGLRDTYPFTECITGATLTEELCTDIPALPGVDTFTDDYGWVPGFEVRDDGSLFFRDADASTVVPSVGVQTYSNRIVFSDGTPATQYYGLDLGVTGLTGTGNPIDDGVSYGTKIEVRQVLDGNRSAIIRVTPPRDE